MSLTLLFSGSGSAAAPFKGLASVGVSAQPRSPVVTSMVLGTFAALLAAAPTPPAYAELTDVPQHSAYKVALADTSQSSPSLLLNQAPALPRAAVVSNAKTWPQQPTAEGFKGTPLALQGVTPSPFVNTVFNQSAQLRTLGDTSQSAWVTAYGATPTPFVNTQFTQVAWLNRVLTDTSNETQKVLYSDAVVPTFNAPTIQIDRTRPVVDTTQDSPIALLAALPPPVINPPFMPVARYLHKLADTSLGIPKPLFADSASPFAIAPTLLVDRVRPVTDTSQGAFAAFNTAVPAPFFNPPGLTPDKIRQTLADSSYETQKVLYPDAAIPAFDAPVHQVDRVRPVVDTSTSSSQTLLAPVVVANNQPRAPVLSNGKTWPELKTAEGFKGSPLALLTSTQPSPFVNTLLPVPGRLQVLDDSTSGTPKPLYADAVAPFFVAPTVTPDRVRPVTDTSQQAWLTLQQLAAVFPAPGQVLLGVVYGPNGNDYTGTLVASGGGSYIRRR